MFKLVLMNEEKRKKISHKKIDHEICHDEKIKKMATKK